MGNKKAWLRVTEAFIAVLIIASVILVVITRAPTERTGDIHSIQRFILQETASNETLRQEILDDNVIDKKATQDFIETLVPTSWNFTVKVCGINEICRMDYYMEKEIYADEILISSTLQEYKPKKLKMFMWER